MEQTNKKHIITISGRPGSGKSTTAKQVAAKLGFEHFSSGDLFRAIAKEKGIELMQANVTSEQNSEIDHAVDGRLREINEEEDRLVIDSRTAWHWMPASFKVFLDLDMETAAQRILKNMDKERLENEHLPSDPKAYAEILQRRLESEKKRYKSLYDINPYDASNYDLVINSGKHSLDEVVEQVLQRFEAWLSNEPRET